MKNILMALFLGSAFFACVGDISTTLEIDHANSLLTANNSFKIWCKTSRLENGVEQDISNMDGTDFLLFQYLDGETDSLVVGATGDCSSETYTALYDSLNYQVVGDIDDKFEKMIYLVRDDTVADTLEVLDITSIYLRIAFDEEGVDVEETYLAE